MRTYTADEVDEMIGRALAREREQQKPLTPLLFSRRKAIADKLGVPIDATFNAIVREVEAAHKITIEAAHGIKGDAS